MGKADVSISLDFFARPEELPLLEQLRGPLATWLHKLGAAPAAAEQMACRLPDYFVTALHETWRNAPQDYAALAQHFDTPFTKATGDMQGWRLYGQWLQRQVSDRMFAEAFGVDKVYVPLPAYYEEKSAKDSSRQAYLCEDKQCARIVVNLESDFRQWLETIAEPSVEPIPLFFQRVKMATVWDEKGVFSVQFVIRIAPFEDQV